MAVVHGYTKRDRLRRKLQRVTRATVLATTGAWMSTTGMLVRMVIVAGIFITTATVTDNFWLRSIGYFFGYLTLRMFFVDRWGAEREDAVIEALRRSAGSRGNRVNVEHGLVYDDEGPVGPIETDEFWDD